jgi:hypothetical protein
VNQVTLAGFSGWCAGVSSRSSAIEQQAAWNFLAMLLHERGQASFPGAVKSPCREELLADPAPWVGTELTVAEGYEYLEAVGSSLRDRRLVAEIPIPGRREFRTALTDGLTEALAKGGEPEAALAGVAERWRSLIDQMGREKVHNAYRRSLGLSIPTARIGGQRTAGERGAPAGASPLMRDAWGPIPQPAGH